jgi:hypothetical protein
MAELALVAPLFFMTIMGIIVVGIGLFYQQQLTNAAREGARFASISSATALCPVGSNRAPDETVAGDYFACDPPNAWPQMRAHARSLVFGLPANDVHLTACWSGYWTKDGLGNWADYDAPPPDIAAVATYFRGCTIGGVDPRTATNSLSCPATPTSLTDDMASSYAASSGTTANQVTVYACYVWHPPMAGFLLIPSEVTLRAVITEAMQYQE